MSEDDNSITNFSYDPLLFKNQISIEKCNDEHTSWGFTYHYPKMNDKDHVNTCECNDDDESSDSQPRGERWPPLGAPDDEDEIELEKLIRSHAEYDNYEQKREVSKRDQERLRELEEEQEQLNSSLLALTSHFAQVQFRLKQIVDASPSEKEKLLLQLEEFANRGIPDVRQQTNEKSLTVEDSDPETRLDVGHERQKQLIGQLKQQLEDLEDYAYQTGEAGLPQSVILQKQRAIIDQLKGKLNLNVDDFDKLTVDDLKSQVDQAIKELVNPLRMKEQLVTQLQTQIVDLERFIEFLQDGGPEPLDAASTSDCKCEGHLQPDTFPPRRRQSGFNMRGRKSSNMRNSSTRKQQISEDAESLISRATTLLSMLTFAQLGCGGRRGADFEMNILKKTPAHCHWGDLRAALEMAVACVCETADVAVLEETNCDDSSQDPVDCGAICSSEAVTALVRKRLCPALRDLIQHGLMPMGQSRTLVPFFSCFPQRSHRISQVMHAWDLVLKYYHLKNGDHYNCTPARKLSQSFNLDITSGGTGTTNKQLLLQTIGTILNSHGPLKRSHDSHFKAFVSAALNKKKLNTWFKLIFRTQSLVESYYQPWSYVAKTGFEDAFRSLEQLIKYNFDLPVDLAVKPFQNIKDVFN